MNHYFVALFWGLTQETKNALCSLGPEDNFIYATMTKGKYRDECIAALSRLENLPMLIQFHVDDQGGIDGFNYTGNPALWTWDIVTSRS